MDTLPWAAPDRWTTYLDAPVDFPRPVDLDDHVVFGLSREMVVRHGQGRVAVAVAGQEPDLSWTVAAAVRTYWQHTGRLPGLPDARDPKTGWRKVARWEDVARQRPVWWSPPSGLRADEVTSALAEALGAPVPRGRNPTEWVCDLLLVRAVPVLVLAGLHAVVAPSDLPAVVSHLVDRTRTLLVLVEPDPDRVLFHGGNGRELASRTALTRLSPPTLAKVLPFPARRA
ncbi:hypothetical protein [Umezawaea sp. NPDC059074]|uniref:hypothetical protein n=1 Tax=Umezawaea sp. NPDC059074 TaxID=3346716 RepID=UPI0036CF17EE